LQAIQAHAIQKRLETEHENLIKKKFIGEGQ
jgi:hypothetical protein